MKDYVIFYIDKGCGKDYLFKQLLTHGFDKEYFENLLNDMTTNNEITIGKKSNWVVVNKFMPNSAQKLKDE